MIRWHFVRGGPRDSAEPRVNFTFELANHCGRRHPRPRTRPFSRIAPERVLATLHIDAPQNDVLVR